MNQSVRTEPGHDRCSRRSSFCAAMLLWFAHEANLWGTQIPSEILEELEINARLERVANQERRRRSTSR